MLIIKKRTVAFEVEAKDWCDAQQWLMQKDNCEKIVLYSHCFPVNSTARKAAAVAAQIERKA